MTTTNAQRKRNHGCRSRSRRIRRWIVSLFSLDDWSVQGTKIDFGIYVRRGVAKSRGRGRSRKVMRACGVARGKEEANAATWSESSPAVT